MIIRFDLFDMFYGKSHIVSTIPFRKFVFFRLVSFYSCLCDHTFKYLKVDYLKKDSQTQFDYLHLLRLIPQTTFLVAFNQENGREPLMSLIAYIKVRIKDGGTIK